jgi:hypothetical protein
MSKFATAVTLLLTFCVGVGLLDAYLLGAATSSDLASYLTK